MARSIALRLLLVVTAALVVPACGNDTPTAGDAQRAGLVVSVNPSPVPPSFNTLTGVVSIGYRVVITETEGLGGELQFVAAQVYDPVTGALANITYFDGADLIVFVGTKRIDPGETLEVPQTMNYVLPEARVNSLLTINVQMKDDRDNLINQSVLVKVE